MGTRPSLGLNVITGPGDAQDLTNLMESVQGVFDETVICVTTDEPAVVAAAKKYATRYCEFKWIGDFSAARNYCMSRSTTDYIMWLDSDDIIKPDDKTKLTHLRDNDLHKYHVIMMPYIYASNPDGSPIMVLPRERIVINNGKHQWHEPIHEYIDISCPEGKITQIPINVTHCRSKPYDPNRNLVALEKEYGRPGHSPRCEFYYGKELYDSGRAIEALPVLTKYVEGPPEFNDNKASACIRIAKYWLDCDKPDLTEQWAKKGIEFSEAYAELYCLMGEAYERRKNWGEALKWFKKARETPFGAAGMAQQIDFYTFVPSAKASSCLHNAGDFENAIKAADDALRFRPDNEAVAKIRSMSVEKQAAKDPYKNQIEWLTRQVNTLLRAQKTRKSVVIWTGPAWEPWDHTTVAKGMAGSETWATMIAREFAKQYDVTIYNDCPDKQGAIYDGPVRYRDHTHYWHDMAQTHTDYLISSRSVAPIGPRAHADKQYVMVHDIWLDSNPATDLRINEIQGFAYLSKWHKEFLQRHHHIPENKLFKTMNGVYPGLYTPNIPKTNSMVWSSSLDRGIDVLMDILPYIRAEVPDFTVDVCYGIENWLKACEQRNQPKSVPEALVKRIKTTPGMFYHGRVSKTLLAQLQCRAKIWVYPTSFTETFSVTAVENGMSKNAIICSRFAGLEDTVGSAGLTCPQPLQPTLFAKAAIKCLKDEEFRQTYADKAFTKMKSYTWENAAKGWIDAFND